MSSEQAARIVFVAGMIEASYVLVRGSRKTLVAGTTYRSLWAIGVLTLGLAVFADFVPQVAGPLALLVLIAMVIRNRGELGSVLGTSAADYPSSEASTPAGTVGHR